MPGIPILTTERLTIRQLLDEDVTGIFMLRSDPLVNQYLNRPPCKTMEDAMRFISRIRDSHSLYWAIIDNSTEKIIGTIGLFDFSADLATCEIGYELMPGAQGKGFMREALQSLIAFAVNELEVRTIEAYTHRDNKRSADLLLKFKFEQISKGQQEDEHLLLYRWHSFVAL